MEFLVGSGRLALLAPFRATCARCCRRRAFVTFGPLQSGHNKWSKIRHDKGKADSKKAAQRSTLFKDISIASRLFGPDPQFNSQLAAALTAARKAGVPKANIENAIAHGQGRSSTGARLENVMLEVLTPSSVALVVAVQTDNRNRALHDLRHIVKTHGAVVTPTTFLFTRQGRSVLQPKTPRPDDFDNMMMQAIEAGAEDVEDVGEGTYVVITAPNITHQTAQALSKSMDAQIVESDIVWTPTAEMARLPDADAARAFADMLVAFREYSDVQGVYANVEKGDLADDVWEVIEDNLD